jgi:hypothetical protein
VISVLQEGENRHCPHVFQDYVSPSATQPKGLMQVIVQTAGTFAFMYNLSKGIS